MKRVRGRLTYANVMSTLAVVIAIGGGTAFAAIELGKNTVRSRHLASGAVRPPDIARGAVKRNKIAGAAVDAKRLAAGAVKPGKIAVGAVTSNRIADGAIETGKIASGAVDESRLDPGLKAKANRLQPGGVVRVNADQGNQSQATEHTLLSRGPLRIYAKCWEAGTVVTGQAYVSTSQPGALASGTLSSFRGGSGSSYLGPESLESGRRFANSTTSLYPNTTGVISGAATVIHGSTTVQVGVSGFTKGRDVAANESNYGAGPARCVFVSYLIAASG